MPPMEQEGPQLPQTHGADHSREQAHVPAQENGRGHSEAHVCQCGGETFMYRPRGLERYDFESFDVESFVDGIKALRTGAKAVDFDDAEVTDKRLSDISSALRSEGCACAALSMYDNRICAESARHLAETLRINSTVQVLNLTGYPIPINILRGGSHETEEITAGSGAFTDRDVDFQLYVHAENKGLDLSKEKYSSLDCIIIGKLLEYNKELDTLNLSSSHLDDRCVNHLCAGLRNNRTLRLLSFSHNKIRDEGAIALAQYLESNESLIELDLDDNLIKEKGAMAIGNMLKVNTTLASLKIRKNDFSGKVFLDALKVNESLTDFACDGLDDKSLREIGFETNPHDIVMQPKRAK